MLLFFHPQSCCYIVGNAADEQGGAEIPGLVWHPSWSRVYPLQKEPIPSQEVAGGLRTWTGFSRCVQVRWCHSYWPNTSFLLCHCYEEQFSPKQREEKVEMLTRGVGASLLLPGFEAVFVCNVAERNQRHFLEYFENGIWQTCRSQPPTVCVDSGLFSLFLKHMTVGWCHSCFCHPFCASSGERNGPLNLLGPPCWHLAFLHFQSFLCPVRQGRRLQITVRGWAVTNIRPEELKCLTFRQRLPEIKTCKDLCTHTMSFSRVCKTYVQIWRFLLFLGNLHILAASQKKPCVE